MVFLENIPDGRGESTGRIEKISCLYGNKACDQIQQCGFSTTGRSDNRCKFTWKEIKINICQRVGFSGLAVISVREISDG